MLHVRVEVARVRVVYGIVKNLAVSIFFGVSFIYKSVNRFFPFKRRIVLYNSQLVPILMVPDASEDTRTINRNIKESYGSLLSVKTTD